MTALNILVAICLQAPATSVVQSGFSLDNDLEAVLGTAGLNTRTARLDQNILSQFRQGEFASTLFEACYENPWRMPFHMNIARQQLNTTSSKPSDSLMTIGRLQGVGIRRTLIGNPIDAAIKASENQDSLAGVLAKMKAAGVIKKDFPTLASVPRDVQKAAALVLQVALDTIPYRRAAFAAISDLSKAYQDALRSESGFESPEAAAATLRTYRSVDMKFLAAGAHDVTLAAQQAIPLLQAVSPAEDFRWELETAWGAILLCGGKNDIHVDKPTLLLIDTGGADTYVNLPANQSATNWLSIVLDTSGKDKYVSDIALANTSLPQWSGRSGGRSQAGPGGAVLGYAVLIDHADDDIYRSHRPGLASANFGAAAVFDAAGNDTYEQYADGQAFARFGLAVLEDLAGDDRYTGFTQVQGCGLTGGAAALIDRGGRDEYVAVDTVIDFPSPQSAEHNVSMSQGAGYGRRADYLDGHSLSGGVGILFDQDGNDSYTCGVFGQGVGYWEGIGALWDAKGDDQYKGQWYVQGASAHFAIGYLEDEAGNDTYTAPMNMAQGAGHDFGHGMLVERSGNDVYQAPNLSLGAGNANGLGIFFELAGDDRYASSGITLGKAAEAPKNTLRERAICLGLFVDAGGTDTYPEAAAWAKNGQRTANITDRGPTPAEGQLGIFFDR
ncbi:MAG: hypothetical protein HONBIEJF_02205 [Fimbriimonadaceae bacterium]|nr:hypothetical protein [Fimbriimonadaceae bacterium]